jgi:hypothetical protein
MICLLFLAWPTVRARQGARLIIGRKAAIKVLNADMAQNAEIVTRFFNEARAANAVRHPGGRPSRRRGMAAPSPPKRRRDRPRP